MNRLFYRKIRKLILHPKKYFIDYFYKKLNIKSLQDQINNQNHRIAELNRMINILTVYTDHKGLQRGDLFVYANQDKIFPDDFIRAFRDKFYKALGYFPDLKNPRTFNEKVNWLKFHYFNPNESICADKSTLKKYVSEHIGGEFVIPLIGIYEDVSDIDFEKLPEQVVFKNTASGMGRGVRVIRNKSETDIDKLKFELNSVQFDWVKTDFLGMFNPKMRDVKMRLIAEEYIEQINGRVYDYKFFCFHGKAEFFYMKIPCDDTKSVADGKCFWPMYDREFKRTRFQFRRRALPDTDPTPPLTLNRC